MSSDTKKAETLLLGISAFLESLWSLKWWGVAQSNPRPQIARPRAENKRLGTVRLQVWRRRINRYLMAHGQPLTTKRPSSRIRHSTSRFGTSAPSIDTSYRLVK